MSHCLDCNSTYDTPGTCNCFAPGGRRAPVIGPWRPTTAPAETTPWAPPPPPTVVTITVPDGPNVTCHTANEAVRHHARAAYGVNHPAACGIVGALNMQC